MLDDSAVSQSVLGEIAPEGSLSPPSVHSAQKLQPFCGDGEGWGPLSRFRFDLTPCFLDLGVSIIAVFFGVVLGSGALWLLFKRRIPQPVSRNWHFYAKLVGCLLM